MNREDLDEVVRQINQVVDTIPTRLFTGPTLVEEFEGKKGYFWIWEDQRTLPRTGELVTLQLFLAHPISTEVAGVTDGSFWLESGYQVRVQDFIVGAGWYTDPPVIRGKISGRRIDLDDVRNYHVPSRAWFVRQLEEGRRLALLSIPGLYQLLDKTEPNLVKAS